LIGTFVWVEIESRVLEILQHCFPQRAGFAGKHRDFPLSAVRQLLIRAECEGGNDRLTVHESGIGLAAEGADRLFESFYTTKPDGMGIGLSISRSIIEAHHGQL